MFFIKAHVHSWKWINCTIFMSFSCVLEWKECVEGWYDAFDTCDNLKQNVIDMQIFIIKQLSFIFNILWFLRTNISTVNDSSRDTLYTCIFFLKTYTFAIVFRYLKNSLVLFIKCGKYSTCIPRIWRILEKMKMSSEDVNFLSCDYMNFITYTMFIKAV